ncbi:cobalamin-binding protein [Streptomyces roseirectus]|uniref:Cobalamin-binding protein n=1 Tax=Streptomyces roseirectus TaxID=2768066 RepID=A0A7H0IA46_9ACTN|nr:helical backbone metal receptor [Streptomyces roseirectus]QNP69662.1 cobalamin-binding protein [Streptomyces roseirectus]
MYDDMGTPVHLPRPPRRVVSLVPSLTEALAGTGVLVGATDWCTHPADLGVSRVRGTKNPDRAAIAALAPDLVIANKEENRELDVARLRAAGVPVWVTVVETVPQALDSLGRLFTQALRVAEPGWLGEARELWGGAPAPVTATVAVPVWRDPWMVVGGSTFTGDLLRRAGLANVFDGDARGRYPRVEAAEIRADAVLLPDEPYVFTAEDGPEMFPGRTVRLVSGRSLTWYGPSLVAAHDMLARLAAGI